MQKVYDLQIIFIYIRIHEIVKSESTRLLIYSRLINESLPSFNIISISRKKWNSYFLALVVGFEVSEEANLCRWDFACSHLKINKRRYLVMNFINWYGNTWKYVETLFKFIKKNTVLFAWVFIFLHHS